MERMFESSIAFNQPIDKWDVSNVTDMKEMFMMSKAFNQPIEKWNVSNVTSMKQMFKNAKSFKQNFPTNGKRKQVTHNHLFVVPKIKKDCILILSCMVVMNVHA